MEVFCTTAMPKSRASGLAMNGTFRIGMAVIPSVLGAVVLSGCASETASQIFVEPDRFILYSCKELATQAQGNFARQHELEALMAKAGPGGGQIASAMAYQPEYAQLRGEMTQLRKAAADRKCPPWPPAPPASSPASTSGPTPGARPRDQALR